MLHVELRKPGCAISTSREVMLWQAQVTSLGAQLDDVRQRVPAELAAQLAQALQHCRPLLFANPGVTMLTAAPALPGK